MSIYDNALKIPLPRYLQEHKDEILHVFDHTRGSNYDPNSWQEYFQNDHIVSNDLSKIIKRYPARITRKDVSHFAHVARSGGYKELKRLFLACMIWGWGEGGKYKQGLKNTKAALSDSGLREVLTKTVELISDGHVSEAYKGFKLRGCRSAFFTKFFYFVGQEYDVKPLPLIRDKHVMNFLEFLSKDEGWNSSICARILERKEKGYIQYICSMDDWAKELGCSADNIEYFIFKEDKEGTSLRKHRREKNMGRKCQSAREMNTTWLTQAKEFSQQHGLTGDSRIIEDMEWPPSWRLSKGGNGNKPGWWFRRAIQGNYILLWEYHGIKELPEDWSNPPRFKKALMDYLHTSEGKAWRERNKPSWLGHPSSEQQPVTPLGPRESITISLSTEQKAQLEKMAVERGVDAPTLALIWILDHLR
jgi:hypothetical protein